MGVLVGMMDVLIILGVIVVIVLAVLCASIFIVPQQQAYIIERFGKYNKVQFAGIHAKIPFVDRISTKTNMRVSQLNVQLETKTLDNVFVTVVASTQFRVNPENVATAYYELRDPAGQLRSYMEDALRSAIPAASASMTPSPARTTSPSTCRRRSAPRWRASASPSSRR